METEKNLTNGENIGFIEKRVDGYIITSRARKAGTREDGIKKNWINFNIDWISRKKKRAEKTSARIQRSAQ